MTEDEKKDEREKSYLRDLRQNRDYSLKSADYSMNRIDLLIISISGAGIYACLEILKYLRENNICGATHFKIVGLLFGFAIFINFISQWAAYYANKNNLSATKKVIYDRENDTDSKSEIAKFDCYVKILGSITKITNILSTLSMLIALIYICICFCITF